MHTFPQLIQATKSLVASPAWSVPEPDTKYVHFDAPLEINNVTELGLFLHGGAIKFAPDRNVVFEICLRDSKSRRRIPLERIEWRSLQGGHRNPRQRGPRGLRDHYCSASHYHEFDLNWVEAERRMRSGNLPIARDINPEPQSFEDLRAFVGKQFNINNIELVAPPEWEYDLFHETGA